MLLSDIQVNDSRNAYLAANLAYFFSKRNKAVGIEFDTEFVYGLKRYALLALSKEERFDYNVTVLRKMIDVVREQIRALIASAKTDEEKIKIHPKVLGLYKVFDGLVEEINKLGGAE